MFHMQLVKPTTITLLKPLNNGVYKCTAVKTVPLECVYIILVMQKMFKCCYAQF